MALNILWDSLTYRRGAFEHSRLLEALEALISSLSSNEGSILNRVGFPTSVGVAKFGHL
jgi:hypothetical protein